MEWGLTSWIMTCTPRAAAASWRDGRQSPLYARLQPERQGGTGFKV